MDKFNRNLILMGAIALFAGGTLAGWGMGLALRAAIITALIATALYVAASITALATITRRARTLRPAGEQAVNPERHRARGSS